MGSPVVLQNSYDGDGKRLTRVQNGTTTYYIGEWCEYNPSNQTYTVYYPFNGQPIAMKTGATVSYLHRDQVGSVVAATKADGSEQFAMRYWSFGSSRLSSGSVVTDRLFTGQVRDLGNDSYYFFKARYYDAAIGKYHVADTVVPDPKNPQALNRYAYALNNPLRYVDPIGHDAWDPNWVAQFKAAHGARSHPAGLERLSVLAKPFREAGRSRSQ